MTFYQLPTAHKTVKVRVTTGDTGNYANSALQLRVDRYFLVLPVTPE